MERPKLGVDIGGVPGYKRNTSTKTICGLEPTGVELQEAKAFEGKQAGGFFPGPGPAKTR